MPTQTDYNCTQVELYTGTDTVLTSYKDHLNDFKDFSPMYTAQTAVGLKAQLVAAEALPDEDVRDETTETQIVLMKTSCDGGCELMQTLKRYMEKTWKGDLLKPKLGAAGFGYYEKAAGYNWEASKTLLNDGVTFITTPVNADALKPVMATNFQEKLTTQRDGFVTLYNALIQLEEGNRVGTGEKLVANNALYQAIIEVCKDGRDIFKRNEDVRAEFTWDTVVTLVGGTGVTGLRGVLTDANGMLLAGVLVRSSDKKYETTTDADGKYAFNQITGGKHTFEFSKAGFVSQSVEVDLTVGVGKKVDVTLVAS